MEEVTDEPTELVQRVAALDIGKASLVCCVRVPHESRPGARPARRAGSAQRSGQSL